MEELIYRGSRVKNLSIHDGLKEIGREGVVTECGNGNYLINTGIRRVFQTELEVSLLQQQPRKTKNLWNGAKTELSKALTKTA